MCAKMHKSAAFYINPPSNLKTQSSFMIIIGIICGVIGILVTFLDKMLRTILEFFKFLEII